MKTGFTICLLFLRCALLAMLITAGGFLFAAEPDSPGVVTNRAVDGAVVRWNEMRFGMLIHWGLYSQWGCHYPGTNGQLRNGGSEQMMRHLKIPLAQYARIADLFNPTNFNAEDWVRVARDAGMKYMVITAKHHDGFAMWDSRCSDYNIVKRTPWHRDPLKELADACKKQGIKLGIYYSLGRDWQDPDACTKDGYRSNSWDYPGETNKVFSRYFERKVKPQLTELLTGYGPISVMWFDTPEEISAAESQEVVELIHKLQPACVMNTRVGNHLGDYLTIEQRTPDGPLDQLWETCLPLNNHWAYFVGDENWKSASLLVRDLVNIVRDGGNCLVGVGPTGDGTILPAAIEQLRQVGTWMKTNGESLYGTTDALVEDQPDWGGIVKRNNRFYLHVIDWPTDGKLIVPAIGTRSFTNAFFLADQRKLALNITAGQNGKSFAIDLPMRPVDSLDTVVVLE